MWVEGFAGRGCCLNNIFITPSFFVMSILEVDFLGMCRQALIQIN